MIDLCFDEIIQRLDRLDIPRFDMVVGIATGGVIPAALVATKIHADLMTLRVEFRDKDNQILYSRPRVHADGRLPEGITSILIVDDVAVTGKTMNAVRALWPKKNIQTLVFKGKADYVLLPEVDTCVNWPWKTIMKQEA
jgi:adenine/guanine phosphoribosyltransferase-like PRPP-binding protein